MLRVYSAFFTFDLACKFLVAVSCQPLSDDALSISLTVRVGERLTAMNYSYSSKPS